SANIDHLVIGAGNVFVIDTKAWRGALAVHGDGTLWYGPILFNEILDRLRWQGDEVAVRLSRRLDQPVEVHPVLCLHGPQASPDPLRLSGVTVATGVSLLGVLLATTATAALFDLVRLTRAAAELFPTR